MQTPNTPRGRETERLMLLWRKQNPDASASDYNREWDSVYRKLEGVSDAVLRDAMNLDLHGTTAPGFAEPIDASEDTTDPYPVGFVASSSDHVKTEPRRRRKHSAQTKGAFGKRKPYPHR